ncbi:reverse transcriptase domain-containing protein [Tanacetum coccineum]
MNQNRSCSFARSVDLACILWDGGIVYGYYLADGIYRSGKYRQIIPVATDPKHTYFKQRQESARKDVERAFGVLQGRSDYTLRSIQEDGQCRNVIAETAELCFSFRDKYEYERRKKEKLEEVKARLDFGEARRKSTKAQESAYSESRTMSPRRQTKARRESTVFKRLGSRGRSASAHSDSRQESSVYRGLTLKSEDSEGDTGNLNPKDRSRVEDEISPTWVCAETDPFTSRIRHFDFPKTRMPSHVKTYNGSEDPEDHLKIFQAATKTERWAMPGPPLTMMSHMFNSTLTGNARVWFDDLPPESIDKRPRSEGTSEEDNEFKAARSIPAQKCLPLPDKMMTETSGFWSREDNARGNSLKKASDSALWRVGLFRYKVNTDGLVVSSWMISKEVYDEDDFFVGGHMLSTTYLGTDWTSLNWSEWVEVLVVKQQVVRSTRFDLVVRKEGSLCGKACSDIGIQEKKAKLFNEWERFASTDGESIESYYHRFSKLMNDFKRNKHFPKKIASNLKFLNNLQPE